MSLSSGALKVTVIGSISAFLSILALALRCWSRFIKKTGFKFNDYSVIAATILALGGVGVNLGVPGQLLWAAANTCVKLSIISLYTILFPVKRFCYLCYVAIAVTLCYFASVVVETFALCTPVEFNWDKNIPGGNCEHQTAAFLGAAITNLLIDVFIVGLPMPMLFGLRMSLQKRLSIAGMFGLGGIICIISMLRVISVAQWDLDDVTYATTNVSIYSVLEPCLGVVNACLPTIQPAMKRIFGDVVASWSSHDSQGTPIDTKISRNRERQNAQYIRDHNFRRLEDDIPLTTIRSDHGGDSDQNNGNAITVTRQWEVDSS
ncbi:unnamed protein product [Clonostachys chloroleuca]|uniref:Rhodopsin domain-containing protein n=1 Tax=Clonostachys chloroleuca TaxID=1926264 RepID=A0AA35LRN7_9HYPO|nr:unnamed protein product [Clonostachys chloroleuca]